MIGSFKSKGLRELWLTGRSSKIDSRMWTRIVRRLDRLNSVPNVVDVNLPGFDFHALHGFDPVRYSIHVNGPWCITFEFENGEARDIDFEQYH